MSKIKDFFEMSKRERIGTIVVLVLLTIIMVATVLQRSCEPSPPVIEHMDELERFETEADSAVVTSVKPKGTKRTKSKSAKKGRHHAPKKDKQPRGPHPIDPVPQFLI